MISRFKQYFVQRIQSKELLSELLPKIESIRKQSDLIAFSPENTGHHWLGIKNASRNLFGEQYLSLPQHYSNSLLTQKHLSLLAKRIAELKFSYVVFRGFSLYFEQLIRQIKTLHPATKLFIMLAGPASEFSIPQQQLQIAAAVRLAKDGVVEKIGFNKKGLAEAISNIYGIKCGSYMVKTPLIHLGKRQKLFSGKISKIGVLGSDSFNKNLHTQVIAALQIENAHVYVLNEQPFRYLASNRITGIGRHLTHSDFIELLSQMDVNYYICFSESWGQVVTESLSVGVPCLTTASSGIFDYDEYLASMLVVRDYDNVIAIAQQTLALQNDYRKITERGMRYIQELNSMADEKLTAFLYS